MTQTNSYQDIALETATTLQLASFQNPEFAGSLDTLQRCQIINHEDEEKVGLFVKQSVLDLIGWTGEEPKNKHKFRSGAVETGVLLQSPSMHIIAVSPRLVQSRKTKEILENYETQQGKNLYNELQEDGVLRTLYIIYLVGTENENLHKVPLVLTVAGVAAAKLGTAYKQFKIKMEIAYSETYGLDYMPLNEYFHSLCIFQPTFIPSLEPPNAPSDKRSWVAIPQRVASPLRPTTEEELTKFCCVHKHPTIHAMLNSAKSKGFSTKLPKAAEIAEEDMPALPPADASAKTITTTAKAVDDRTH